MIVIMMLCSIAFDLGNMCRQYKSHQNCKTGVICLQTTVIRDPDFKVTKVAGELAQDF